MKTRRKGILGEDTVKKLIELPLVPDSNAYLKKKIEKPSQHFKIAVGDHTRTGSETITELLRFHLPGAMIIVNAR